MAAADEAQFFDGRSARSHAVKVTLAHDRLAIAGPSLERPLAWPLDALRAVDATRPAGPLRLSLAGDPGARLTIPAGPLAERILAAAPNLAGRAGLAHVLRWMAGIAAGFAAVAAVGYGLMTLAPQHLARVIPDAWRARMADGLEPTLLRQARRCNDPAGTAALNAVARRIVAHLPDPPDFSVRVFDLPMMNAFALPAGRIVITGKLIETAGSAEELAGVLAHELGHVAHLHPEAAVVRIAGLQVIVTLITGGTAGDTVGSVAGLLALLRYTRQAEWEADSYARQTLLGAAVDPKGLRDFFERVSREEGPSSSGLPGRVSDLFSTHPGTEERMKAIVPAPPDTTSPVLSDAQWQALKAICKTS